MSPVQTPARRLALPAGFAHWAWITAGRIRYGPGDAYAWHRHSHVELFWVEEGRLRHRTAEGFMDLVPGTGVFLRPDHAHALSTGAQGRCSLVNIRIRSELVEEIEGRHRSRLPRWPWPDGLVPGLVRFTPDQQERLATWIGALGRSGSRLAAEAFLLDCLRLVGESRVSEASRLPPWLARAMRIFTEEGQLEGGVPAFIAATGRSTDHVNRIVRRHLGLTTASLVERLRLTKAARALRMGDTPLVQIALDCGYQNLTTFYRAFRRRFETSPGMFRDTHREAPADGSW